MRATILERRNSSGALLSRLIWPSAVLLVGTLAFGLLVTLWTTDKANRGAADRERLQMLAALDQRLDYLTRSLAQIVEHTGVRPKADDRNTMRDLAVATAAHFEAAGVFVLTGSETKARVVEGPPEERRMLASPPVERLVAAAVAEAVHSTGDAATRLLATAEGSIYGILVHPHADVGDPRRLVTVALDRLSHPELVRMANRHSLKGFTVGPLHLPESLIGLQISDENGESAVHLGWTAERPGDQIRERHISVGLFATLLLLALFGLAVAHMRRIAAELASNQERVQNLAEHDSLSGLPNRLLLGHRLDQELSRIDRHGGSLAVMFLDLDRFKEVNDTYGHQAGDQLIKAVAERLAGNLRASDTLARLGGDEFAIIQTGLRGPQDCETLSRRILDELTNPFCIDGKPVTVGVSIGIVTSPANGTDAPTLMRLADTALYQAKSDGRNRYCFFEQRLDETVRIRKIVEDELREAILDDRLVLHYQPIYSADGATLVALEALVRWIHPEQGLIAPDKFISLAEQSGLIIPLGEWVLKRACQDGRRWPGIRIAVNVSPIQFRHRDFVPGVMRALNETGFDASRLELELTEGVVVEDADAAEAAMMELRALGVHLALDDFGTGYSSLIYLRRFAFDKIKIDRSFLESMEATGESAILVHSIVHLGRALGLSVTAEGVETKEQHRFLQALGCHELQGFLFSRPVAAERIDELVGGTAPSGECASAA